MTEHKPPAIPKAIQLPCILDISGRHYLTGETRELSEHEATVQIPALAFSETQKPRHDEKCKLSPVHFLLWLP